MKLLHTHWGIVNRFINRLPFHSMEFDRGTFLMDHTQFHVYKLIRLVCTER